MLRIFVINILIAFCPLMIWGTNCFSIDSLNPPILSLDSIPQLKEKELKEIEKVHKLAKQLTFTPSSQRATWLALVIPGAGQIYNRKYWKLPIFYGGFLGCTYAFLWNQQMYNDYSQAYLDIADNNPETKSYLKILPPTYQVAGREQFLEKIFKRKRDFYRRNRDLSIFAFAGVYILSVVDAYVDAELSAFDISKDLSLRIKPAIIQTSSLNSFQLNTSLGVGCSLLF